MKEAHTVIFVKPTWSWRMTWKVCTAPILGVPSAAFFVLVTAREGGASQRHH